MEYFAFVETVMDDTVVCLMMNVLCLVEEMLGNCVEEVGLISSTILQVIEREGYHILTLSWLFQLIPLSYGISPSIISSTTESPSRNAHNI